MVGNGTCQPVRRSLRAPRRTPGALVTLHGRAVLVPDYNRLSRGFAGRELEVGMVDMGYAVAFEKFPVQQHGLEKPVDRNRPAVNSFYGLRLRYTHSYRKL